MKSVLIIGLGYVGLPLALQVLESGEYSITGLDISPQRVIAIQEGTASWVSNQEQERLRKFAHTWKISSKLSSRSRFDYVLICVPTPVDKTWQPDLQPVISATETAAQHLKSGGLIVLESTVHPGVCEEILVPLIEKIGFAIGHTAFLAHCPERIDPGNTRFPFSRIPRVIGADSPKGLQKALSFYRSFLQAELHPVSSLRTAEASKIVENAFRDINIAFVNELAQSFQEIGIDVTEVIQAAATKPFGFLAHYPGCGVGGHCIPVDPYYLIESAHHRGFEHRFLRLAREINTGMPQYTMKLLQKEMKKLQLAPDIPVTLLGLSYKAGISDERNSPAQQLATLLQKEFTNLEVYDPYVLAKSSVKTLEEALLNAKVVVIATAHTVFVEALENRPLPHLQLILDGRNCLQKWPAQVQYRGIGR